ncbi:hypothetical protein pb186bvf_020227 [Paramecium bursaria]
MPKQKQAPQGSGGKFASTGDAVADDRNWIGRVNNELTCTAAWNRDWGFLAGKSDNLKLEDATRPYDIDEQIRNLQQEMEKIQVDKNKVTINRIYGKGDSLEQFVQHENNKLKNKDLKAQDRKIPKGWAFDKKWKPPEDPNDPLAKMFQNKGGKKK